MGSIGVMTTVKKYIEAINNDNMCSRFLLQGREGLKDHYEFTDLSTGFYIRVWNGPAGCKISSFFNGVETVPIREALEAWMDRSKEINSSHLEAIKENESRKRRFYFNTLYGGENE